MLFFALLACNQFGTLTVKVDYSWGSSQLVPKYYEEQLPVYIQGEILGVVGDGILLPPTNSDQAYTVVVGDAERTKDNLPLYSIFGHDHEWWVSPLAQAQVALGDEQRLVIPAHRYPEGEWSCRRLFESDADVTTGPVVMEGVDTLTLQDMNPLTVDGDTVHAVLDNGELWGYFPKVDVLLMRHYLDGIGYRDYAQCWNALTDEPDWTEYPMDDVVARE